MRGRNGCQALSADGALAWCAERVIPGKGFCRAHLEANHKHRELVQANDLLALEPAERVARLVAFVLACPDDGPKPWQDGDPRCHCTHCEGCGRLYRTEDIQMHRDVCVIGLVVRGTRAQRFEATGG